MLIGKVHGKYNKSCEGKLHREGIVTRKLRVHSKTLLRTITRTNTVTFCSQHSLKWN